MQDPPLSHIMLLWYNCPSSFIIWEST